MVVDPRRSETAALGGILWIAPKPGTDAALLLGLIRFLIDENLYDDGFMRAVDQRAFLDLSQTGKFLRSAELADQANGEDYLVWDEQKGQAAAVDVSKHPDQWNLAPALASAVQVRLKNGEQLVAKTAFQYLREKAEAFASIA